MRNFTRIAIRLAMIMFLLVGCVQNFYYVGKLIRDPNYPISNDYTYHDTNAAIDTNNVTINEINEPYEFLE